jgi:hypothetical protein
MSLIWMEKAAFNKKASIIFDIMRIQKDFSLFVPVPRHDLHPCAATPCPVEFGLI